MDPLVFLLVAAGAGLHVAWNVVMKTAADPFRSAAVMMSVGAILLVPAAVAGWWITGRPEVPMAAIALGVVSGGVEVLYFALLAAAYKRADLSVVYPLARGSSTLLAVGIGVLVLGERLGPTGQIGLLVLLSGLLWLQRPWEILRAASRRRLDGGILFALATGVVIATYSAIDRVGVQLTTPWIYAAIIWATAAGMLVVACVVAGRVSGEGSGLVLDRRTAAAGVSGVGHYLLILIALSLAPLSAVAPLRQSAVVLASAWGVWRLREAADRQDGAERLAAAGLVVVGAILLGMDG